MRGEPGVDYPIYGTSSFKLSSFSCSERVTGVYYADPELGCQVCIIDFLVHHDHYGTQCTHVPGLQCLPVGKEITAEDVFSVSKRNTLQPDQACV